MALSSSTNAGQHAAPSPAPAPVHALLQCMSALQLATDDSTRQSAQLQLTRLQLLPLCDAQSSQPFPAIDQLASLDITADSSIASQPHYIESLCWIIASSQYESTQFNNNSSAAISIELRLLACVLLRQSLSGIFQSDPFAIYNFVFSIDLVDRRQAVSAAMCHRSAAVSLRHSLTRKQFDCMLRHMPRLSRAAVSAGLLLAASRSSARACTVIVRVRLQSLRY